MSIDFESTHEEDVIDVVLRQHDRIKVLFTELRSEHGEHKQDVFDELRALLAAHETGEEMVIRPVAEASIGKGEADARNAEENEATHVLADLEKLDVSSAEFDQKIADFEKAVLTHAEHEEREELPPLRAAKGDAERRDMGRRFLAAERMAPPHAHPSAAGSPAKQTVMGPFASLLDRARDAIGGSKNT
jgi:hemerythrin superfamily protein